MEYTFTRKTIGIHIHKDIYKHPCVIVLQENLETQNRSRERSGWAGSELEINRVGGGSRQDSRLKWGRRWMRC